jgi:TPP-dependent pyruvate/acetoin dehydrogenase alpha subunit
MNLAELWSLPVLFVCENNLYAMGVPLEMSEVQSAIFRKAQAYLMPSETVDGMNPVAVEGAARRAVASIRAGDGPYFLECHTYRFRAHSMFDAQLYRTKQEVERWKERDPIPRTRQWLRENGMASDEEIRVVESEIDLEVQQAVDFAGAGTLESIDDLERFALMVEVPE